MYSLCGLVCSLTILTSSFLYIFALLCTHVGLCVVTCTCALSLLVQSQYSRFLSATVDDCNKLKYFEVNRKFVNFCYSFYSLRNQKAPQIANNRYNDINDESAIVEVPLP